MASQITGVLTVNSTVCSGADQRKHQSSASLSFVRGIHGWPVTSPHKGPVTRKRFPYDEVHHAMDVINRLFNIYMSQYNGWYFVDDQLKFHLSFPKDRINSKSLPEAIIAQCVYAALGLGELSYQRKLSEVCITTSCVLLSSLSGA